MLPEMCVHVTVGVGIPSAEHVILSDVLYSRSTISAIIGATADEKHKLYGKSWQLSGRGVTSWIDVKRPKFKSWTGQNIIEKITDEQ